MQTAAQFLKNYMGARKAQMQFQVKHQNQSNETYKLLKQTHLFGKSIWFNDNKPVSELLFRV